MKRTDKEALRELMLSQRLADARMYANLLARDCAGRLTDDQRKEIADAFVRSFAMKGAGE